MKCPECGYEFKEVCAYCSGCGMKLVVAIKDQTKQEINSALDELDTPTPLKDSDTGDRVDTDDEGDLSYETDDVRKNEYKQLLKEIFSNGRVDVDIIRVLADKIRELGLDKNEAVNIQKDVAREMGIDIEEAGDIVSTDVVLEINTNKAYVVNEMNNFEFRVRNVCDEPLKDINISRTLLNLDEKKEKTLNKINAYGSKNVFLAFHHKNYGNEVVEVRMLYYDSKDNPSAYETEFEVKVYKEDEVPSGNKSISISFKADKILGNDFSELANIIEKKNEQEPERGSSYDVSEKQWKRLCIFLDEEETSSKRNEATITINMATGEEKLRDGGVCQKEAREVYYKEKDRAVEMFKDAYDCFKEAEDCFKKVREINPEHEESLKWARKSRKLINEIEGIIGPQNGGGPGGEKDNLTSACLEVGATQKKFFVYSKDRVTLGRNSKNDLVLRLKPNSPKEEYPENYENSQRISGSHLEIKYKLGSFYITDTNSANGTFLERERLSPKKDYLLNDGVRLNVARVLDLECHFLGNLKMAANTEFFTSSCVTVLGDSANSCFGIDKRGDINAIRLKRRNNYVDGEEYMILIREVTIGRSNGNGIVLDGDKVSDIHAKLFYRDGQYWLEDLNSGCGTKVNGQELVQGIEAPLGKHAEITIGDVDMTFDGME
jgi:pSer/pThr/pTyr-binding forkhead associated (FHA) protein